MTKKNSFHRLSALDGLRGFAILLVFFNHIPTGYILQVIPMWLFGWIFVNGVTGVTFLFILSGFLMYYIYPNPNNGVVFWQKRYTRIFPLFLTMSAIMFTGRQLPHASWLLLIAILFSYPTVTHILWTKGVKRLPKLFGKSLFLMFFALQLGMGFFYIFWINKQTFAQFSSLPTIIHEGIIFLTNVTLTLPFGQYVPMLDGVYWSLASEILFYLLYPLVVVPLIAFLLPKPRKVKITFLIVLFFLLGGIHMLSYKIFVLSLIQPALFFYFATGITLAYVYKNKPHLFKKMGTFFSGKWYIFPAILGFATVMSVHDLSFLGQWISPWVRMIFAIPITFCVALLLSKKTILQSFFSSPKLIFLGTISYSLYLSHSLVIYLAELFYFPQNLVTNISFVLATFAVACVVAYYLYVMLEAPYFVRDKHVLAVHKSGLVAKINGVYLFPIIICIYLLAMVAAYQSKDRYNFFSLVLPISKSHFTQPVLKENQSTFAINSSTSATLEIPATANNFGILSLQLTHKPIKNNTGPQALYFTLTQKGDTRPIEVATYSLDQFNNGGDFPFGFPNIPDAKGKIYIAHFSVSNPTSQDFVTVSATSAKSVYSANKKSLLTNPKEFGIFVWSKMQSIVLNAEAQLVFIFLFPFVLFSLLALRIGKRHIFRYN